MLVHSITRWALAFATLIALLCPLTASASGPAALVPGDWCEVRGAQHVPWTTAAKHRTQERIIIGLEDLKVSRAIFAFHRVVICREAFCGEASVRHLLGHDSVSGDEDGLGAHGLSLYWTRLLWPGDDEDPAYCTPEASLAIAHEIVWRAFTRHGARNLWEVQSVYGGHVERYNGESVFTLSAQRRSNFCHRIAKYGERCDREITRADLGIRLSEEERRDWALGLAREYVAGWLGRDA